MHCFLYLYICFCIILMRRFFILVWWLNSMHLVVPLSRVTSLVSQRNTTLLTLLLHPLLEWCPLTLKEYNSNHTIAGAMRVNVHDNIIRWVTFNTKGTHLHALKLIHSQGWFPLTLKGLNFMPQIATFSRVIFPDTKGRQLYSHITWTTIHDSLWQ